MKSSAVNLKIPLGHKIAHKLGIEKISWCTIYNFECCEKTKGGDA